MAAGIAGSVLYEVLSRLNMEKLSSTLEMDQGWDEEWDRFVRVPKELQGDIEEWFIAPDSEIVSEREKFDVENNVGNREIVMVRHGQYLAGGELSQLGKEQAEKTANRLAEVLASQNLKVRCIYHSDMMRARQTAEAISKRFPGVALRETHLLAEAIPAEPNPPTINCPEFVIAEGNRLEKGFRSFFARPVGEDNTERSVDILVGHGNCFRFFVCRAMQVDPRYWLRMAINNCGICVVDIDTDGRVSVRSVGDVGHLPPSHLTYN